jgi:hypothetical protein
MTLDRWQERVVQVQKRRPSAAVAACLIWALDTAVEV